MTAERTESSLLSTSQSNAYTLSLSHPLTVLSCSETSTVTKRVPFPNVYVILVGQSTQVSELSSAPSTYISQLSQYVSTLPILSNYLYLFSLSLLTTSRVTENVSNHRVANISDK